MGEAGRGWQEIDGLAEQVFLETVAAGMSQAEQAEALYTYLTQNVDYDFRYYSHPGEMPYESTTAYGALHNNLAICGGYAQAFQTLLEKAGIPCITVSGKAGGETHVEYGQDRWPLALLRSHRRSGQGPIMVSFTAALKGKLWTVIHGMQIGSTGSQKLYFHCDCKWRQKELGRADPHRV